MPDMLILSADRPSANLTGWPMLLSRSSGAKPKPYEYQGAIAALRFEVADRNSQKKHRKSATSMAEDLRRHTEFEKQPRGVRFLCKSPDGARTKLAEL